MAESDEELLDKYLENDTLSRKISSPVSPGNNESGVVPVFSARLKTVGIAGCGGVIETLPSPAAVKRWQPKFPVVAVGESQPEETPAALVFKTMVDPFVGKLTFRVYSGVVKSTPPLIPPNQDERIGQLF